MSKPPLHENISRLTIVCPSWVGDTVMATPVLRAVRDHLPQARIVAVLRPGLEELLAGSTFVDECKTLSMKGVIGAWRAGRTIRRLEPDAILLLPNSFRSALCARLSGAPIRIGYDRDGRGGLLTHRENVWTSPEPVPTIEYYGRLGEFAIGADSIPLQMKLAVSDEQNAAASKLLDGVDTPFVVLNVGGNKTPKRWPADRFAKIADAIAESHGMRVVVSGSPGEMDVLQEVVEAAETEIVNLAERGVTLGSLKGVLQRAALLITNDTGPRHIAAALGTPIVGLFGPTDPRWTTLPGVNEKILVAEPFLPGHLIADEHPKACAIARIPVTDVVAVARALLDDCDG